MTRRSLPSLVSELEQSALLLLVAAVVAVAVAVAFLPLPDGLAARTATVAAIAALVVLLALQAARAVAQRYLREPVRQLAERAASLADGSALPDLQAPASRELEALTTALQRIAARLQRAEQSASDAERMASVGRVAAGIAHEVGNPMSAIANYLHVLRGRCDDTAAAREVFTALEAEIDRIDHILSSALDYARPATAIIGVVDLADTLERTIRLLQDQGVLRRITLRFDRPSTPLWVVGNARELQQAFVNLIVNATEAMGGSGPLSVWVSPTTPAQMLAAIRPPPPPPGAPPYPRNSQPRLEHWLRSHPVDLPTAKVVVADAGTGIDVEARDRIFDPFYTTKGPDAGTGLGLAIVQRVVEVVQGTVWVERSREGGAAFHMLFPLCDPPTE
jgi:two-component system, NtrC family, sensor kinase